MSARMPPFAGFDLSGFWEDSDYARKEYIEAPPDADMIAHVEARLGYRLPASYIALMRGQNGGIPGPCCFPAGGIGWAEDHVKISAFKAIGEKRLWSLCGGLGSRHKIDNWDYPDIGIYFGDCPTAGHQMFALDYRDCGREGEPAVVYVNQERDYRITRLAEDFETFVRGLLLESVFYEEDPEVVRQDALADVRSAPFGLRLRKLCDQWPDPRMPDAIRRVAEAIVEDKGFFALDADANSQLMYAVQLLLLSHVRPVRSAEGFMQSYPGVIAMVGGADFGTGRWAPGFVEDWFRACAAAGQLVQQDGGWCFSPEHRAAVLQGLFDDDAVDA